VYRLAREEGISGRVRNDSQGVTIEAFGSECAIEEFLRKLSAAPPPAAVVREVRSHPIPPEPTGDFLIEASRESGARRVSIPPDLATCELCAAELFDPSNRRHGYPFTNCTHCGPRFTIARDVPYDRSTTTMAHFEMCDPCRREYQDPLDRRFHAQPNACPVCGPQLKLCSSAGAEIAGLSPLAAAVSQLRAGRIVAVKGLGGFHLACDATSSSAVRRLRERKKRDQKPFAVMVPDLAAAARIAVLSPAEGALLGSVERPIVLLARQPHSGLAAELAPGNSLVGVMLPYTPLHHLLLCDFGGPLVMTSGNLSEEPMVQEESEAFQRLGGIADLFLVHDRKIENRCDDSVARVIAGHPVVLRRSRGYVPRGIELDRPLDRPVLACGAHLKNTFCLASGDTAYLGPHIGDLESLESCRAFEQAVERLQRFLAIRPQVIAYDLHPDYFSTLYALRRPEAVKVAVQHHHAHIVSAMAEHRLEGPVLGLAYDGTGYGTDGTAWGGELLLADYSAFERLGTFRPIRLAGSDQAIREVWRIALALLDDAFAGDPPLERLALFGGIAESKVELVRQMIARGLHAPQAHGVGRYFDGLGALVLARPLSHHEGQVALEWNLAADPAERASYPFELESGPLLQVDFRPLVRAAVDDLIRGASAARISARFHNAIARASGELVRQAAARAGRHPVVLSGGCFQNALLAQRVLETLAPEFTVYLHREVPPGDGGIALGQALVADALARSSS
jgi:hydrogenase maturation protein HypF